MAQRPRWQIQSQGRIDAKPTLAKTGSDFIRQNGGMLPAEVSNKIGGVSDFYRNQVMPNAHDKLQAKAAWEQGQAGGFRGGGMNMAELAKKSEAQRIAAADFAGRPPTTIIPGTQDGDQKEDKFGNQWTFDAKLGRGVPMPGSRLRDKEGAMWQINAGTGESEKLGGSQAAPSFAGQPPAQGDVAQDDGMVAPFVGAMNDKDIDPGEKFAAPNRLNVAQNQVAEPETQQPFFRQPGTVNPDFINRRVRDFTRTPEGAFAYSDMQGRQESARQKEANAIEKFNVGQKNSFAKQEIQNTEIGKRQAASVQSQRELAKEAFDRQQGAELDKEGRKKAETDLEKQREEFKKGGVESQARAVEKARLKQSIASGAVPKEVQGVLEGVTDSKVIKDALDYFEGAHAKKIESEQKIAKEAKVEERRKVQEEKISKMKPSQITSEIKNYQKMIDDWSGDETDPVLQHFKDARDQLQKAWQAHPEISGGSQTPPAQQSKTGNKGPAASAQDKINQLKAAAGG